MEKRGFTLAEVLITLAIIGVVAALTLPNLSVDIQAAKIGPKLGKAVSMFEQANEALLNAEGVDSLTDAGYVAGEEDTHSIALSNYMKAIAVNEEEPLRLLTSKDGVDYYWEFDDEPDTGDIPHKVKVGNLTIDINGLESNPNAWGTDQFAFALFDDGSLRPMGGREWDGTANADTWQDKCPKADDGVVTEYMYCAGHIFENNMKVLYK